MTCLLSNRSPLIYALVTVSKGSFLSVGQSGVMPSSRTGPLLLSGETTPVRRPRPNHPGWVGRALCHRRQPPSQFHRPSWCSSAQKAASPGAQPGSSLSWRCALGSRTTSSPARTRLGRGPCLSPHLPGIGARSVRKSTVQSACTPF